MTKSVNNFAGLNGFVWWVGEIRGYDDSLGIGRLRVRIFGWYGKEIGDADLPLAQVMHPVNTRNTFGVPQIGDWVMGFFMDGESAQFPVVMGVLPGMSQGTDSNNVAF